MKKYEIYKDSGIEWIGEIPEHWSLNKVKHNFSFKTGFTPPSGKTEYYEGGSHIWINISDLQEKEIHDSANKITDKAIEEFKPEIVPKGSLLYSFKLSVGRVGFNMVDCYTNEAIFSIDPNGSANLNFFYYSLPEQIIKNANENIYGAKILNQELIKNAFLVVPTPEEQTAIANYLDRKTAEIDELIADKIRLLELYNEEKTAIINQAVTKGINPNVPMKDSGIEWLGEIPEHWEVKMLKYVANSYPSNVDKKSKEGEKEVLLCNYVDVYKNDFITSEIQFMKATASDSQVEKFKLKKGDVIATKDSESPEDIAIAALVREDFENVICGYHLNFIRPIHIFGDFLFRFFQSKYTKGYFFNAANGVTRYGIGTEKFSNFVICVPPFVEQQSIVHHIETECTRIDTKKSNTKKLIDLLTEYRTALISEVVTGKIKVTK